MAVPDRTELRQFITDYFNDLELHILQFDYFQDVEFGENWPKSAKVLELIEYSERHGKYESLVSVIEKERLELFKNQFSRVSENIQEDTNISIENFSKVAVKKIATEEPQFTLCQPFEWVDLKAKGFSISKYPITVKQYELFVRDDGYKTNNWWSLEGLSFKLDTKLIPKPFESRMADHPINGVSLYEAIAFCSWLSEQTGQQVRLPTISEWMFAASGVEAQTYTWGNTWDSNRCRNSVPPSKVEGTSSVYEYEGVGDSKFGLVDMIGNVWEWCINEGKSSGNRFPLKGGSWESSHPGFFSISHNYQLDPTNSDYDHGFRIVKRY